MKRLALLSLLLGLIPSANAAGTCEFVSEYYPDVTIEIENQKNFIGVQWHPELAKHSKETKKLFSWLLG